MLLKEIVSKKLKIRKKAPVLQGLSLSLGCILVFAFFSFTLLFVVLFLLPVCYPDRNIIFIFVVGNKSNDKVAMRKSVSTKAKEPIRLRTKKTF